MACATVECRPLNHHFVELLVQWPAALAMSVYSILHKPKNEKRQAMLTATRRAPAKAQAMIPYYITLTLL